MKWSPEYRETKKQLSQFNTAHVVSNEVIPFTLHLQLGIPTTEDYQDFIQDFLQIVDEISSQTNVDTHFLQMKNIKYV